MMMHQETDPTGNCRWMIRVAAIAGFAGVALGAFGAHGLEDLLEAHGRMDTWRTAVLYHLVHATVLLILALGVAGGPVRKRGVFLCFFGGIVVFSGSLYTLAVTNVSWLGAITPLGGVLFLAGWLWLAVAARV